VRIVLGDGRGPASNTPAAAASFGAKKLDDDAHRCILPDREGEDGA
jgi:hypothetical protein